MVWTMIGNYPYKVEILSLHPCKQPKPWGIFQYDNIYVWRKDKGTSHKRKMHQIFKTKEIIKKYLFPT